MDSPEAKILTAVLIACVIVGFIIVYFVVSLIRQQRRTLQLNRQNVLSEIAMLEKDRVRMAADLHDELGPLLSQIKFRVNSLEPVDEDDREQRDLSSHQIDEVIERVRGIARNLMPGSLVRKGLRPALEETAAGFSKNTPLQVKLEFLTTREVQEDRSINIYRVIQEIAHNTLRHANASQLLIRIWEEAGKLTILCEDNGKGFDFEAMLKENRGLGLRNLKSRIEIMGGRFNVLSKADKGTQYLFQIPF